MNAETMPPDKNSHAPLTWTRRFQQRIERVKNLNGDPHYIALGMAIGVFVAFTPTIPFHTVIAVALSFILRGSKAAAAIGVWISNPITIPFFYLASYKAGVFLFGISLSSHTTARSLSELWQLGVHITIAAVIGGISLGVLPALATYLITRKIVSNIRRHRNLIQKQAFNEHLKSCNPTK